MGASVEGPSPAARAADGAPAWDADALLDPHSRDDKAARVQAMFDAIADTYERVNAVVSLGQDARWRRRSVAAAGVRADDIALDVCCGTGDMVRALAAHEPAPRLILGLDFSAQMLSRGVYDGIRTPVQLLRADALRMPLASQSVDLITCAFGVRNLQDLAGGLAEFLRVLRPGGRCVILEFALPDNPLVRAGYRFYCERVLPLLAAWISRDRSGAYRYLPRSIRTFERRAALSDRLRSAGFWNVSAIPLHFGGVVIYRAEKPRARPWASG